MKAVARLEYVLNPLKKWTLHAKGSEQVHHVFLCRNYKYRNEKTVNSWHTGVRVTGEQTSNQKKPGGVAVDILYVDWWKSNRNIWI